MRTKGALAIPRPHTTAHSPPCSSQLHLFDELLTREPSEYASVPPRSDAESNAAALSRGHLPGRPSNPYEGLSEAAAGQFALAGCDFFCTQARDCSV